MKKQTPRASRPVRLSIFIRRYLRNITKDHTFELASSTAYHLVLSILPLSLFLLSMLHRLNFLSPQEEGLALALPPSVMAIIRQAMGDRSVTAPLSVISLITLLWSSSSAILGMMRGIFNAYSDGKHESMPWTAYPIAILVLLGLTAALASSLFLTVLGTNLLTRLFAYWQLNADFFKDILLRLGVTGFLCLFVWMLYYVTPGYKVKFRTLWPGALFAATGWSALSSLFEIYMGRFSNYVTLYGGIGAFLGLVLWLYAIALLILLGAELNATLLQSPRRPKDALVFTVPKREP